MTTKWERELVDMATAEGLEVLAVERNKSLKMKLRNKAGRCFGYTAALTPSDRRAVLNIRASFRRLSRGG